MATILVVDDELGIRALLSEILTDAGHVVEVANDAAQARACLDRIQPDLVLLDIWMPDVDGVTLLKEWSSGARLTMPVIMLSGHGSIDSAVEATKLGAMNFLEKPITLQKLLRAVEQGLAKPAIRSPSPISGGRVDAELTLARAMTGATGLPGGPVPSPEQSFKLDQPLRDARDAFERSYFEFHLAQENGSMTRVAERTGLERTHLYRKLRQLGVEIIPRSKKVSAG